MSLFDKFGTASAAAREHALDWRGGDGPPQHPPRRRAYSAADELARVMALPRREVLDPKSPRAQALVEIMTDRLGRKRTSPCECRARWGHCIDRLLPEQAWALYEMPLAGTAEDGAAPVGGLLGAISVGGGKTTLNILAPLVVPNVRTAVLLIPPGNREQLYLEYLRVREHFRVPSLVMNDDKRRGHVVDGAPTLQVVPYSVFSRPESTSILERQYEPDLIIADELHALRSRDTARSARFLRYFVDRPDTRLCGWSGTLFSESIRDVAHLAALSLGVGSPLPILPAVADEWAAEVDPQVGYYQHRAKTLAPLCTPGESPEAAVHRRIAETRGFVSTRAASVGASINLWQRTPPRVPPHLLEMLDEVRKTWTRPDGEELVEAIEKAAVCKQLACGFYYRWIFPHGESEELIAEWFAARKAWNKELRAKLLRPEPHLDSPLLCARAAARAWGDADLIKPYDKPPPDGWHPLTEEERAVYGDALELIGTADETEFVRDAARLLREDDRPMWRAQSWPRWRDVRGQVYHETRAVWVDDYLAADAAAWAAEHRGIVWYEYGAFGQRIAELAGIPYHGGGPGAEARILAERGDRSIVASIAAHGEGRDGLQRLFYETLIANFPSSARKAEQLLGRTHRQGQAASSVNNWCYRHTPEMADAVDRAVRLAKFVEGISGNHQKLLAASCDFIEVES